MRTQDALGMALRRAVAPTCLAVALIAPSVSRALDVPVVGANGMISAGHPLAVPPRGAAPVFHVVWPASVLAAAYFVLRRQT